MKIYGGQLALTRYFVADPRSFGDPLNEDDERYPLGQFVHASHTGYAYKTIEEAKKDINFVDDLDVRVMKVEMRISVATQNCGIGHCRHAATKMREDRSGRAYFCARHFEEFGS
jgi:hypothetical protein